MSLDVSEPFFDSAVHTATLSPPIALDPERKFFRSFQHHERKPLGDHIVLLQTFFKIFGNANVSMHCQIRGVTKQINIHVLLIQIPVLYNMSEKINVHEVRNILSKFSNGTKRKRKHNVTNPLVQYVEALLQPHIVSHTKCELPFDVISEYEDSIVYNVEGNPPFTSLTVYTSNGAFTDFEFD